MLSENTSSFNSCRGCSHLQYPAVMCSPAGICSLQLCSDLCCRLKVWRQSKWCVADVIQRCKSFYYENYALSNDRHTITYLTTLHSIATRPPSGVHLKLSCNIGECATDCVFMLTHLLQSHLPWEFSRCDPELPVCLSPSLYHLVFASVLRLSQAHSTFLDSLPLCGASPRGSIFHWDLVLLSQNKMQDPLCLDHNIKRDILKLLCWQLIIVLLQNPSVDAHHP